MIGDVYKLVEIIEIVSVTPGTPEYLVQESLHSQYWYCCEDSHDTFAYNGKWAARYGFVDYEVVVRKVKEYVKQRGLA